MESDFKREVARAATDYCAVDETRCGSTPSSSRRKRSSDKMIFTSDRIHILPGYPKESIDDPSVTLLALYLQFPEEFSDDIIDKDVLKAIVESNEQSIGGSVGGTISSVQPLASTTETTEESDEEPKSKNAIIIGLCVGGVILVVILVAIFLHFKRRKR
ncbi:uncharacterized protein LOC110059318 [Orbicella faveolata]|uniref:uncharacterized protein LOC110059318 n=1 Tax=Orbicella faveolata TaxID=48498 RepID=UPI0009E36CB9|nr:uncharacterized protein LOC110059318 [Orbicella faveolata]